MTRFRTTYSFEYEADDDWGAYGTEVPEEMAKIDREQFEQDPEAWFDTLNTAIESSITITVEPVE
jgi:hypothetical protein